MSHRIDPEEPFRARLRHRQAPRALSKAPYLDPGRPRAPVESRYVLLINPFYAKDPHTSFGKHVLTPTLGLTSIAAVTPPEWRVAYWDENLLQGPPPASPTPEVVGITVHLTFARRAYELAAWYRARGATVVLGGLHVTSSPEDAAPHADCIAVGDGVQLWPQILTDIAAHDLKPCYRSAYTRFGDDPVPRRAIVPEASFLTTLSLNATRGCKNRCRFCYLATRNLRLPYQSRPVEDVRREIVDSGQRYAVFTDNNLGASRPYLRALCDALRPLDMIWSAAVSIDVTDDPALVREMATAGCTGVFVGFESLTDQNLADAGKRTPSAADYARRVRLFHDQGIQVNGSFVFGFDHDRRDVFARTVEWIEAQRLECATFHILTPYPGTPLYAELEAQGRLLHQRWDLYDTGHAVFQPKQMSPEDLERGYAWTYERLFSHASILRRRPTDPAAVLPYLAMSYLYKRANPLWHFLIRHQLVHRAWAPLVEVTRRRHLRWRRGLARAPMDLVADAPTECVILPRASDAGVPPGAPATGTPGRDCRESAGSRRGSLPA